MRSGASISAAPIRRFCGSGRAGSPRPYSLYYDAMAFVASNERFIDLSLFERTPLETDPFPYLLVPGFVPDDARAELGRAYPKIDRPGSFPVADLRFGTAFREFLAEIEGPAMRAAFARKFDIDLTGRPT